MALSSSLFTGTSGLKNMGNSLQVTGNNISNINTIGFKKGRANFADTLYESTATRAGADQMGRGMALGDVSQNFTSGSFESTGNTTDLSIGGNGFFVVRQAKSENMFYTRAGNFFFNKAGQLVNPEGYMVQGWELDEETGDDIGAIKDIVMASFTNPPKKSSKITAITNLDADAESKSVVLSNRWDASKDKPMAATAREYQTVIPVYDSLGSAHDVTIFYDKKSGTEWEYTITCNPEEDNRNLVQGTGSKGLLARGTILFSQSSGDILDITMDKFTGRIGNFKSDGINTVDAIDYQIFNEEALNLDGYGFEFEYDGSEWQFVDKDNNGVISPNTEKPKNYPRASIIYSDKQEIHLVLDQTSPPKTEPDLKIKLEAPAVATDTLGFDINNKNDLHVQNVEGIRPFGGAANDNTKLEINTPNVMTHDSKDVGIVWDPAGGPNNKGQWYWSNPKAANTAGTLISGITLDEDGPGGPNLPIELQATSGTAASPVAKVLNAEDMPRMTTGLNVRYDGTNWDWNDKLKEADFTNTYTFVPKNDPAMKITTQGVDGTLLTTTGAGMPTLHWTGAQWVLNTASGATSMAFGSLNIEIDTAASNDTGVSFKMWNGLNGGTGAAGYSEVTYSFGSSLTTASGQSIEFSLDPSPPKEYAGAVIKNSTSGTAEFSIDFDNDKEFDLKLNPQAAGATVVNGALFKFNVDPNVPPPEYKNATLKGDYESAVIDLDGSGNDDDRDDIVFNFKDSLKYGSNTDPFKDRSDIRFDILGSTAWTQLDKSKLETDGYFSFTTDFLGGDFGVTENEIKLDLGSIYQEGRFINDASSTTQYSKASSTVFQDADGYSAGDFLGVEVSSDGIITGRYSNGQLIPLFRVGLAKFMNNYGLSNAGGNLFRETRASGAAITNKPGENGLGTIAPNSLEMSNVDIAEEFVTMITNQRGFQANSKTVTTVDQMYETVIQMKR